MSEADLGGCIGIALVGVFIAQGVGTVAYLAQTWRLFSRLEACHAPVYEALGKPHLLFNNTPRNNVVVLSWLWRRRYEALEDEDTVAMARFVRTLLMYCSVGFVVMMLLFVSLQVVFARMA